METLENGALPESRRIIFIFGLPGAGKSTLADLLGREADYLVLSGGEELRKAILMKDNPVLARRAEVYVSSGRVAPSTFLFPLFLKRLNSAISRGIIFDGFPRTQEHFAALPQLISELTRCCATDILGVHLTINEVQTRKRLSGRFRCSGCGATLSDDFCGRCEGEAHRRDDDADADAVDSRVRSFTRETAYLVQAFKNKYPLVDIDAMLPPQQIARIVLNKARNS